MKLSSLTAIAVTAIACLLLAAANIAWAQDGKARKHQSQTGEPSIITRDYVQDECKLSSDQKQKLSNNSPGFMKIVDTHDNEKIWAFIKEAMNAEQFKRFEQLELQHDGPPALFRSKIAQELKITAELQKAVPGPRSGDAKEDRTADQRGQVRRETGEDGGVQAQSHQDAHGLPGKDDGPHERRAEKAVGGDDRQTIRYSASSLIARWQRRVAAPPLPSDWVPKENAMMVMSRVVRVLGLVAFACAPAAAQEIFEEASRQGQGEEQEEPAQKAAAALERVATGFRMAEGPVWDGERFHFSDVPPSKILTLGADGAVSTLRSDTRWGAGLAFDSKRRLLICEVMGRRVTRVESDRTETTLAESYSGKKLNGPNDLTVDAKDGIYFTDPLFLNKDKREQDKEAVYYIRPDGKLLRVADDLERPNGIALARDGKTLFVADTAKSKLRAYSVKEDGLLGEGRDFGSVKGPDGVKVDLDGNVYAAGQTGIAVWDASGKPLGTLKVPVTPNGLAFGDKDRRTMYITTAPSVYKVRLDQALRMLSAGEK